MFAHVHPKFGLIMKVKHLVVAKMDGDQNSSPLMEDFSWSSYPHIFFVKAEEPAVRNQFFHSLILR